MGLHYVNFALVGSGVIDPAHPQIVLYEPTPNGRPKLTGADYLVDAAQWDSDPKHTGRRRSSWDSCFIISRPPIASASSRSTHCMSGRGRTTPAARLRIGTPNVSCASYVGPTNN